MRTNLNNMTKKKRSCCLKKFLNKLKMELPYDPEIPLLGIYSKKCKSGHNRDTCTLMFIAALLTITKLWKYPRCPTTDKCIKKM
jgi:hypothetical protein